MKKWELQKNAYSQAFFRLAEAVQEAETDLEVDGTIQRFEFTFEQFRKLLKLFLEREGILCRSPRACLKEAYRFGILDDEETVLQMLEDRNETAHLYDEATSRIIYRRIRTQYVDLFDIVYQRLIGGER